MTKKESLQNLVNEGNQVITTMSSPDDKNFLKWTEKVKTVIRRIYNEDSPEYREITEINRAYLAGAAISTDAEILDQAKKDAQRKIAKLEAWAELEVE